MKLLFNQRVLMRDGIQLATDIYLPSDGSGPWPAVLERTPYNRRAASRSEITRSGKKISREELAQSFTDRGFAVIFQDCRGCHGSEGHFTKYVHEAEDGFDTLSWIINRSWCNGRIGTMGLSYAAHTQMALACLNPPGLSCMALDSGGFSNAFQCGIRQGGAFELKQATWAYKQALQSQAAQADSRIRRALEEENIIDWFRHTPWRRGHSPLRHVPDYEDYLLEQWSHGRFDKYWQRLGLYAEGYYDAIPDIPMLFMSSWYDAYVRTTLENFMAMRKHHDSPLMLIMGPWLHGNRNDTFSGGVDFGEAAAFDGNVAKSWLDCRLRWFERWMKAGSGVTNVPHDVHVFLMGGGSGTSNDAGRLDHGGSWLKATSWPLPGSWKSSFYLHADGRLDGKPPESDFGERRFNADPDCPVPTVGGSVTSGLPVFTGGAFDQRESPEFFGSRGDNLPLAARDDILVFQTEPLTQDLIVAGPVELHLYVESDAQDTDFTAKLIDVYPPCKAYPEGYAMNITDSIMRCRYREGWSNPKMMRPGQVVAITIEPFATCNRFQRGHRLRLDIAGSNFPRFDINPNSGEPEGEARHKQHAHNSVHTSSSHPSHLVLTLMTIEQASVLKKSA